MAAARSWIRIAVNVALDGGVAALSVPVARWLADPSAPVWQPLWTVPLGALTLLLAGMPFRLSLQYWRFAAIGDVLTVAASSAAGAVLFTAATALTTGAPPNPAFPAIHALTLLLFLGTPRVYYRWRRGRPPSRSPQLDAASILLVGSIEDADLFIRALAQDRRQAFRVEGLLASSDRQTGRRIQGHRILGSLNDAAAVLAQLKPRIAFPAPWSSSPLNCPARAWPRSSPRPTASACRSARPLARPRWPIPTSRAPSNFAPSRSRICSTARRCRSTETAWRA